MARGEQASGIARCLERLLRLDSNRQTKLHTTPLCWAQGRVSLHQLGLALSVLLIAFEWILEDSRKELN